MISVKEALALTQQAATPKVCDKACDNVDISDALHRVLSAPALAQLTQPPFDASAMDGYAVHSADADLGNRLAIIGEAPAGTLFEGRVNRGEAVRVFTGSVMPQNTHHVVIQEDVRRTDVMKDVMKGAVIEITDDQFPPANVRKAGIDFKKDDILFEAGTVITPLILSVLTAANIQTVSVFKRPKVVVFANGDELRPLGSALKPGQIISSTPASLCALLSEWGAEVEFLGIIPDDKRALLSAIKTAAKTADVIVPLGGASVGDYDLVKDQFKAAGFHTQFEKIAVKPGKPTWFATQGDIKVLGLPGNPASGLACAFLFLKPLIHALSGQTPKPCMITATLTAACSRNGPRETYLRGRAGFNEDGHLEAQPFSRQDSSLLTPFANANVLIQRPPNAPKAQIGDTTSCLLMGDLL